MDRVADRTLERLVVEAAFGLRVTGAALTIPLGNTVVFRASWGLPADLARTRQADRSCDPCVRVIAARGAIAIEDADRALLERLAAACSDRLAELAAQPTPSSELVLDAAATAFAELRNMMQPLDVNLETARAALAELAAEASRLRGESAIALERPTCSRITTPGSPVACAGNSRRARSSSMPRPRRALA